MYFKQSEARGRNKQFKTGAAHGEDGRTASMSISRLRTILGPITMYEASKNNTAADWSFLKLGGWHTATGSGCYVSLLVSIEKGQLEHGNETLEELVGQLLVQGRRANLDSGAGGLLVFSLVSDYGDKQPTIKRSGSCVAACLAQSETRMRGHVSQCANAFPRCEETHSRDHQTRSRTCLGFRFVRLTQTWTRKDLGNRASCQSVDSWSHRVN